jgi:hypothetical protein
MVVVAESIESLSTTSTHERWEKILLEAGYRFAAFDGINRFYVESTHDELAPILAYPISALDHYVTAQACELAVRLEHKSREVESLRRTLDAVHKPRASRAGRLLAAARRPLQSVREHLPKARAS